jgi:hypothetical protein
MSLINYRNSGIIGGWNEQRKVESDLATAEINRNVQQAALFEKLVDIDEKKYDLAEKKTPVQRGSRDAEARSKTEKAERDGYVYASDADSRKAMDAFQKAQMASETGNQQAWDDAMVDMSAAHPVYAQQLKNASTPQERQQIMEAIGKGFQRNYDLSQKAAVLGMEQGHALELLGKKHANNLEVQREKFGALRGMAADKFGYDSDLAAGDRSFKREMAVRAHEMGNMIQEWAERTGEWEQANAMFEAYIKATTEKQRRSGTTTRAPKYGNADKVSGLAMKALAVTDPEAEYAGKDKLVRFIGKQSSIADLPEGEIIDRALARFAYDKEADVMVEMPTDEKGTILGPHTADELAMKARQAGRPLKEVLEQYRNILINQGVIESERDWEFPYER